MFTPSMALDMFCIVKTMVFEALKVHRGPSRFTTSMALDTFCIVKTMVFELPRVPETPNLHHFEHLFFCTRFGRYFFAEFCEFGLPFWSIWGPFGSTFWPLLRRFFRV